MILLRGAEGRDLGPLAALARHLNSYNLPADRAALKKLIALSRASFARRVPADARRYLFVAEETGGKRLIGCSLIIARHGTPQLPHLAFRLETRQKKSSFLKKTVGHRTLQLCADPSGFTEIGGLVVLPRWRGSEHKIGQQLSFARFAFIARRPADFRSHALVEYLPPLEPGHHGNALWRALGARFTGMDYSTADRLSAKNKEFILSLFPKEPIYCTLLPEEAALELGKPGRGAGASLKLLKRLGFRFLSQVDPFDGGPHYGARISSVPLVRRTVFLKAGGGATIKRGVPHLVMTRGARACVAPVARAGRNILLPPDAMRLLRIRDGESVSVTPFEP